MFPERSDTWDSNWKKSLPPDCVILQQAGILKKGEEGSVHRGPANPVFRVSARMTAVVSAGLLLLQHFNMESQHQLSRELPGLQIGPADDIKQPNKSPFMSYAYALLALKDPD